MASRPELREMCAELGLDSNGLSIDEMKEAIRKEADKKWSRKNRLYSANLWSESLKRFLVLEYDFKLRRKDKSLVEVK